MYYNIVQSLKKTKLYLF